MLCKTAIDPVTEHYCGGVSLTGGAMFNFDMSVIFITVSVFGSWLRGSDPLRDLPVYHLDKPCFRYPSTHKPIDSLRSSTSGWDPN